MLPEERLKEAKAALEARRSAWSRMEAEGKAMLPAAAREAYERVSRCLHGTTPGAVMQQIAEVLLRAAKKCLGLADGEASAALDYLLGTGREAVVPCNSMKEFNKNHRAAIALAACKRRFALTKRVMELLASDDRALVVVSETGSI